MHFVEKHEEVYVTDYLSHLKILMKLKQCKNYRTSQQLQDSNLIVILSVLLLKIKQELWKNRFSRILYSRFFRTTYVKNKTKCV